MAKRSVRWLMFLLVLALVLALATGLMACGGSSDNDPAPAASKTTPPAVPNEAPAPATPAPPTETPQTSPTTPTAPIPEPPTAPVEPDAPEASPPTDAPAAPTAPVAETTPLFYDTYDLSGAVTEPGHYAFLADPDDPSTAVTTYEGLRDGSTTALLVHTHDGYGASQATLYAAVEPGDLFEWRQASDCFVRYQVTEVKPDPTGTVPQKLLGVAWMTYAFTGCSGPIAVDTAATFEWGGLPDLGGTSLTTPIRHGPFQIVPEDWTGVTEINTRHEPPAYNRDNPSYTESLAEARRLPYWRKPVLPDGWGGFAYAAADPEDTIYGYRARYRSPAGGIGLLIVGEHLVGRGWPRDAAWRPNGNDLGVTETRVIAGRPAWVSYSPLGPEHIPLFFVNVRIFDPATESRYTVRALTKSLLGANVDGVIAIARSLFANPPLLFYDTYDQSGAVSEPGHYAFLANPDDPTSVVTTYEGLRDGTATALLVHTHDFHGISRTDLFDAVEVGDLFEWRQAGDCFVRYQVTEVKPDPTGTAPQKLLDVAWMTYAFTGCSGTIATTTAATLDWADLPDLGGTSLTTPIRHGSTQLVPQDWTGALEDPEPYHEVPVPNFLQADADDSDDHHGSTDYETTADLTEAQTYPYWRTPALPAGWTFVGAHTHGDCVTYGYCSTFARPDGWHALTIEGSYAVNRGFPVVASWSPNGDDLIVRETRVIAGRPAIVRYSPLGPTHNEFSRVVVGIYDPAPASRYTLDAGAGSLPGSDLDALIAIAASLFAPPNPP